MNLAWLLVLAVYAAAVALARRAKIDIPWRVAALFFVLVLVFLFKPLTGPYVSFPTDVTQLIWPWAVAAPEGLSKYTVSRYEMQDVIFQMAPWAHQVRESWKDLQPPLWNGFAGTGYPLLANMQSAALSPVRLLALPLPLGYAMAAEAAMKMLIAVTFTFLYLRRRYDELPSVIGAIAFGLGSFVIAWIHWPHSTVAVFLPAVAYAIDLLAEARTFGRIVFAAMLGPMIVFGGHPATAVHVVFYAVLFAAWVIVVEMRQGRWRMIATLVAVSIMAAFLAAPVLLPFVDGMSESVRYKDLKLRPHDEGTPYSDFNSLMPLVQPRYGGQNETICGFAGLLGLGAWFGLLVRAIVKRDWRSRETFYLLAFALTFAIIDDWQYVAAPFRELMEMALNSRLRLVIGFLAAVQTAALVHHMRQDRVALGSAIAGGFAVLLFVSFRAKPELLPLIPSVAVLIVAATRIRMLIGAAIVIELWLAMHHTIPIKPVRELYPKTPLIETLLRERGNQVYRIAGVEGTLFPNTQAIFGLEDARVHDATSSMRYAEAIQAAMPYDPIEYYPKFKDPQSPLLDTLNVKWLVADPGVNVGGRWKLIYDGKDGRIYENPTVKPRFVADAGRVDIVRAENDEYELRVDVPHETLIKASIAFWPGWRVKHNGKSLKAGVTDHAFIGFVVPPGRGTVTMKYAPTSFWSGVVAAVVMLAALPIIRRAI